MVSARAAASMAPAAQDGAPPSTDGVDGNRSTPRAEHSLYAGRFRAVVLNGRCTVAVDMVDGVGLRLRGGERSFQHCRECGAGGLGRRGMKGLASETVRRELGIDGRAAPARRALRAPGTAPASPDSTRCGSRRRACRPRAPPIKALNPLNVSRQARRPTDHRVVATLQDRVSA
jgi:hypothetical protein